MRIILVVIGSVAFITSPLTFLVLSLLGCGGSARMPLIVVVGGVYYLSARTSQIGEDAGLCHVAALWNSYLDLSSWVAFS